MTIDYDKLFDSHGDSPRSLDWSPDGQQARFRVLYEIGIKPHHSVLDLGCGLGHFATFLKDRGHGARYTGIDASEKMVQRAHERLPDKDFRTGDVLRDVFPAHDFAVASGVVNIENGHNDADAFKLLFIAFASCRIACAVNFLSNRAVQQAPGRHYFDPGMILDKALGGARLATLRHDYRPNDFTVYMFR